MFVCASACVVGQAARALPKAQNAHAQHASRAPVRSDLQKEVRLNSDPNNPEAPYGMVLIPAGDVIMGTDPDLVPKLGQNFQAQMTEIAAETPRHTREVDQFFIDANEVTNLQWKVYLDATGREPSSVLVTNGWPNSKIPDGQDYFPITLVSLPEIEEFLAWAGKRLPTEAEWTRAARGDDSRSYPWGDKWNSKVVSYGGRSPALPVSVDEFEKGASPFGVVNMAGNVWEWVDTNYTPFKGFEPIPFKLSKREVVPLTPEFDSRRYVIKGGCYVSTRDMSRIDYRVSVDPNDADAGLGFRTARSVHAGAEIIRSSYRRLLPSAITGEDMLDKTDIFAQERASYLEGSDGRIISGFRYLGFAHPKPLRQAGLSRIRKSSKDEPVTLGLLTTSEPLAEPPLPPGDYVVAFKGRGESKKHKEARRNRSKDKKKDDDAEAPPAPPAPNGDSGSLAPWPFAVDDVVEDIEFDQDMDVFLFYNVNNAVVGWTLAGEITESAFAPVTHEVDAEGKKWDIAFSLDVVSKRVPRFTLPIKVAGPGLGTPD